MCKTTEADLALKELLDYIEFNWNDTLRHDPVGFPLASPTYYSVIGEKIVALAQINPSRARDVLPELLCWIERFSLMRAERHRCFRLNIFNVRLPD